MNPREHDCEKCGTRMTPRWKAPSSHSFGYAIIEVPGELRAICPVCGFSKQIMTVEEERAFKKKYGLEDKPQQSEGG